MIFPEVTWLHPKVFEKYLETLSAEDRKYAENVALIDETGWICIVRHNETKNLR